MSGGFAAERSGERCEEDCLAQEAHFVDELFELAMLSNGEAKSLGLLFGKGHRDGLGSDFARPTPSARMTLGHAALAD